MRDARRHVYIYVLVYHTGLSHEFCGMREFVWLLKSCVLHIYSHSVAGNVTRICRLSRRLILTQVNSLSRSILVWISQQNYSWWEDVVGENAGLFRISWKNFVSTNGFSQRNYESWWLEWNYIQYVSPFLMEFFPKGERECNFDFFFCLWCAIYVQCAHKIKHILPYDLLY